MAAYLLGTLRYKARDLPALLRTPLGRAELRGGVFHRAWPLLEGAALAHRATLARHTRVVAVVGSLGKTTTARAVTAALGRDPDGLPRNYLSYLAAGVLAIRPRDAHAVFEAGITGPRVMPRYARMLRPQVAVVTSIATEHNSVLPSLEATRAEKAAMVRALPPSGLAVLNGDDPNVMWMRSQTGAAVTTFGVGEDNDVRATEIAIDWPHGTRFIMHARGERREMRVRLLGEHFVRAALAGAAVAVAEGVGLDSASARIEAMTPTPGRLETIPLEGGAFVVRDDWKGSVETIDSALDVLSEIPARRRIVVLGDVQESPESPAELYERLGARVAAVADRAVFVHHYDGEPRYTGSAVAAGLDDVVDARGGVREAIAAVAPDLLPGDVVLVKGPDAQRLDRVALALAGHLVRCELRACEVKATRCAGCPMLERGWRSAERQQDVGARHAEHGLDERRRRAKA